VKERGDEADTASEGEEKLRMRRRRKKEGGSH